MEWGCLLESRKKQVKVIESLQEPHNPLEKKTWNLCQCLCSPVCICCLHATLNRALNFIIYLINIVVWLEMHLDCSLDAVNAHLTHDCKGDCYLITSPDALSPYISVYSRSLADHADIGGKYDMKYPEALKSLITHFFDELLGRSYFKTFVDCILTVVSFDHYKRNKRVERIQALESVSFSDSFRHGEIIYKF